MLKHTTLILTAFVLQTLACLPAHADDSQPIDIGNRRELFVDHFLIDRLESARLVLNRPRDEGPVLRFDKPWEGLFSGYSTIIKDGAKYRLYYRGMPATGHTSGNEVTCIAESDDGIHWEKPQLGLHEFDGSSEDQHHLGSSSSVP